MILMRIAIVGFLILETANIVALYFFPGERVANSVGVFKAWEKSKSDPDIHNFVKYLVNWVAGTKLIFILLLIVLLLIGDAGTTRLTIMALIISIASFFWRLFPLIRKMDREDQISPRNYSAVLGWMISALIIGFLTAALISL